MIRFFEYFQNVIKVQTDNRPEAIYQRKMQDMANNSSRVMQLQAMQEMANKGYQSRSIFQRKESNNDNLNFPIQRKENNTGLPDNLKSGIENLSGHSMDDVKVHYNSDKPAQLQAHAYAQGTDIHLGAGQEKHLAHEAWHVVQQKQGRVKPTMQMKGKVNVNDDSGLEREADVMGAKASTFSIPKSQNQNSQETVLSSKMPLQMKKIKTHLGTFEDEKYTDNGTNSVSMVLKFEPSSNIDAKKIGLTQSVKAPNGGVPFALDPQEDKRIIKTGTAKGFGIDRLTDRNTPIYGSSDLGTGKGLKHTKKDNNTTTDPTKVGDNATYQIGYHYNDGTLKKKDAKLYDEPTGFSSANSGMEFETTALALEGTQKGTYYGSVKWGYEVDGKGTFKRIELEKISMGMPSQIFLAPALVWKTAKTRGTMVIKSNNTSILDGSLSEKFKAAKGDEFIHKSSAMAGGKVYCLIEKKGDASKSGYVEIGEIEDKGDGKDLVDLPVSTVLKTTKVTALTKDIVGKDKIMDLPKDTRVVSSLLHDSGKHKIEVVDGTHTGKQGYVNKNDLENEK